MVQLLEDFPPHVAAYKASGSVGKEEYERVVMKRVDEVAVEFGKVNFIVVLQTGMEDYTIGAFLQYLKVSFEHFFKWNRMAIVSDEQWVRRAYDFLGHIVHGEIRTYEIKRLDEAREWVSEPL